MILIERDSDGQWPDWAYECASLRLKNVGGTLQWRDPSYRMAYLNVVLNALEKGYAERATSS